MVTPINILNHFLHFYKSERILYGIITLNIMVIINFGNENKAFKVATHSCDVIKEL